MLRISPNVQLGAAKSRSVPRDVVRMSPTMLENPFKKLISILPSRNQRSPVEQARKELLDLAVAGGSSEGARAGALVDTLLASKLPFQERLLGGGPWQVVYSRGPQLWQAYTSPGRFVGQQNRASQDLRPATRTVVNKGELLGANLFVTASGSYSARDDSATLPKAINVSVAEGALHAWGKVFPLPIRGSGKFTIAYLDQDLRVFCSGNNSVTVQVREEELARLRQRRTVTNTAKL